MPRPPTPPGYMLLTVAEYRRLLIAAEGDGSLMWCETCGAWMDIEDPAAGSIVSDYRGCWKMATGREKDAHLCRSARAPDRPTSVDDFGKDWLDYEN